MKIVFFGTPDYVVPILEKLHKSFKSSGGQSPIVAVVTQSPKPTGRKQQLSYSPVDTWAYKKGVPIFFEPQNIINKKIKADIGVIASYGSLLPNELVDYFPFGILVVHPSLLPQFRWGSPVPAAIVTGTNPTGVTIIKMDNKFDHGPIISQFKEEVIDTDNVDSLRSRLFQRSADVLASLIPAYLEGKITPHEQEHDKATFARMIKKEDAFIPPKYLNVALKGKSSKGKWKIGFLKDYKISSSPQVLERFIRAMNPWPVSWTYIQLNSRLKTKDLKRLKILKVHLEEIPNESSVISHKLVLDEVQLEGKSPVSWKQFLEGYPDAKFK